MECVGYTISDRAGHYRHVVEYIDWDAARAACDDEAGDEIGYVWENGAVTFEPIPPEVQHV